MSDALSRTARSEPSVVGTSELDWDKIEQKAGRYVEKKAGQGRYLETGRMLEPKSTWDMMEQKEVMETIGISLLLCNLVLQYCVVRQCVSHILLI